MFNILDWYWSVPGFEGKVWSSARLSYVPTTDGDYKAWHVKNPTGPSVVVGAADLVGVMLTQWLPVASLSGLPLVCTTDSSLSGTYAVDPTGLSNIIAISTGIAAGKPLPGGADTFIYRDVAGTAHVFSAETFTSFAAAVEGYTYGMREGIQDIILGGTASLPVVPVTFG